MKRLLFRFSAALQRWVLPTVALLLTLTPNAHAASPQWQQTLDRVVPAVVVLRVSVPRAFDTEVPAIELATGFVVDARNGLILTNRHVVNPGPATIEAVFLNHEEVPVEIVYRDPVHDFGFVRYDPAAVKFMTPGELSLVPEHARVGTEIRVVGNDAGEKLSILAGTLARLDRSAPEYGHGQYNDFNTFYYQAASSTSGGSSGSPVVDVHGHAVALNAGARLGASSSFYLPLHRVVRALDLLKQGKVIPRGTVQTVFSYRPFDEVRRLGLRPETEATVRRSEPNGIGMLVVREVVPGGPADGKLEVGDVVVNVGGRLTTRFDPLGRALDALVGETLSFEVERGGAAIEVDLNVEDLHSITPSEYLELGGAVLHPLSFQQARSHQVPVGGVRLATPGYMFTRAGVSSNVVITDVDGEPVSSLQDFADRMASFANGQRVPLRYFRLDTVRTPEVAMVTVDRQWFKMQLCRRDDATGEWPCEASPAPPPDIRSQAVTTRFSIDGPRPVRDLAPSLAMVEFDIPFRADGVHGQRFQGTGIVADTERGLVIVDRETVPIALGDVTITFAESLQIPGEVAYIHPVHNLALVRYDPALIGDTPVRAVKFLPMDLVTDDEVWLVGLTSQQQVISRETRVSRIEASHLGLSNPPRFRETNIELISLSDSAPTVGGVLSDKRGRVYAIWAAFSIEGDAGPASLFAGIPARAAIEMLTIARSDGMHAWRNLGVELQPVPLSEARTLGLGAAAAKRVEALPPGSRRVLSVTRIGGGTPAASLLRPGDLLLSIDGKPADSFATVESAAQADRVNLVVLRDGKEVALEVETMARSGRGTERFLFWEGALLQAPHPAVAAQRGVDPGGVYVAWFWYGSPVNRARLQATHRIIEVDGTPVTDLDSFLAAQPDRADGRAVRLKTISLEGRVSVVTLKPDTHFWPTAEIRRGPNGWDRVELQQGQDTSGDRAEVQ
jgi:S1-C subfamily serine protease